MPKRVTTIALTLRPFRNVHCAVGHTNLSAKLVGSSTHLVMSKPLRVLQLNVRKRGEIHESLINDEEISDAAVIAIQEP